MGAIARMARSYYQPNGVLGAIARMARSYYTLASRLASRCIGCVARSKDLKRCRFSRANSRASTSYRLRK